MLLFAIIFIVCTVIIFLSWLIAEIKDDNIAVGLVCLIIGIIAAAGMIADTIMFVSNYI